MLEKSSQQYFLMIFWQRYLNTEIATVNVVSKEQVPCCGWWSSHFKQLHKIKELPVDVPTHCKTSKGQQTLQDHTESHWISLSSSFFQVLLSYVTDIKTTHSSCSAHVSALWLGHFGTVHSVKQLQWLKSLKMKSGTCNMTPNLVTNSSYSTCSV